MTPRVCEPTILAGEPPQTHALDHAAIGTISNLPYVLYIPFIHRAVSISGEM